jgi:hypothetical protein
MIVYLAGGIMGNNKALWQEYMKIYLAGNNGGKAEPLKKTFELNSPDDIYILESYYYIIKEDWIFPLIKQFKGFLLDSGAFTYMTGNGGKVNWDSYIEQYAAFINKHDIKLFFELDIDSIVGLKEVERLRSKLEALTNKKCIPCWHKNRGLEYWKQMCRDYNYVAIGTTNNGLKAADGTTRQKLMGIMSGMIRIAKENKAKVHGLGYTNLEGLKEFKFNSVDSTAWLYGNRSGIIYKFNGSSIIKIKKPPGTRLNAKEVAINNFNEWVKFQKYAETNL